MKSQTEKEYLEKFDSMSKEERQRAYAYALTFLVSVLKEKSDATRK